MKNLIFVFVLAVTLALGTNFAFAAPPIIVSATADNITETSATLNGTVNPNGGSITASFIDKNGNNLWASGLLNGSSDIDLPPYDLTGLTPGTDYTFRLVTSNGPDTVIEDILFTTTPLPLPSIISATASGITQTAATLNGVVNPNGGTITASFVDEDGNNLWSGTFSGSSNETLPPYDLTGLTSGTAYTFRLVASNGPDTVVEDILFTTLSGGGGPPTSPTLTSLSPSNGDQGETLSVTLTGTNFASGATSDFGSGITVNSTNFVNSTSLTANISISASTTIGARSVTVTTGGQTTNSQTFTVNSSGGGGSGGGGGGGSYYSPSVTTQNASNITINSATLNASINPNGYATTAWFEYSTSSTLAMASETTHIDQGTGSTASALMQDITGLSGNTTYYFRAVANNTYGTTKGSILSLKTTSEITNPINNNQNDLVVTVVATKKTATSAQLNGIFVNQDSLPVKVYFQYGKSSSLGSSTIAKDLSIVPSMSFSSGITNLEPDTIYFFRAVAINQNSIYYGNILVFKTLKEAAMSETIPVIEKPVEIVSPVEMDYSNMATAEFRIASSVTNVSEGDEINYTVSFKNITEKDFENVKITVQLPKEVDFRESNLGRAGNGNTVIFEIPALISNQMGSMTIKAKVNSNVSLEKALVTTAIMSYTIAGPNIDKDEMAYITNYVTPAQQATGLEANPLFGITSMPRLLGWIALILVVLVVAIFLGRRIYLKNGLRKSTNAITDQVNNS